MLQSILIYICKVIICNGMFAIYYFSALRNKRFHFYNRFYILASVALSTLLPLLHLQWFTFSSSSSQTIRLFKIVYGNGEPDVIVTGNPLLSWQQWILFLIATISFIFLAFLFLRVTRIQRLKKKYPVQQLPEFNFITTDIQQAPFSFLKNIFWRNDISLNDETGRQILQHEITHVKQKHSWDKLFVQTMLCFFWMNPFYYLLKKELYLIHEFIADERATYKNDAAAFAKMLLASQYGNFMFSPAQSIFYSPIKRRLLMLTTSKKPQFSYARRLMILPLFGVTICLFAFTLKNENHISSNKKIVSNKPFVLVVDAGHGGRDYGAVNNNLNEKDITLQIAKEIKTLSAQYGVNVILTRNSDVFMSPQQKSNFANSQHADAFISIHINSDGKNSSDSSGFEVLISGNEKLLQNNQSLGSAILQNISTDFKAEHSLIETPSRVWVLSNSNIPAALIECGYINNVADADNLKNDAKIELMAKNILQGVAMYTNNNSDKSKVLQLNNSNFKDTNAPAHIVLDGPSTSKKTQPPLYVLDGEIISAVEAKKINVTDIESINVLKDKTATDKYGDEAVRIIAQGPKWIPAMQNGRKVIFMQKQNITFEVAD